MESNHINNSAII